MISILEPYLSPNDMLRLLQPPVFHVAFLNRIPTTVDIQESPWSDVDVSSWG
jgi:hypothetical protein